MNYKHVEKIKKFKKIGLLGNHCRFIVETIATFENNVSYYYIIFAISVNFIFIFILSKRDICFF